MQPTFRHVPESAPVRPMPNSTLPATAVPTLKEIPYDYVATFTLQGKPGNRVQDVINISTDGAFVAVAIGYSFIAARLPGQLILSPLGARARPAVLPLFGGVFDLEGLVPGLIGRLAGIDFKYSIIDSASGRELQNKAIHNIAGLGEAAGNRPFRPFAKPQLFLPRSTIRIEIEEVSQGVSEEKQNSNKPDQLYSIYGYTDITTNTRVGPELSIVLHGYKILGYGTG